LGLVDNRPDMNTSGRGLVFIYNSEEEASCSAKPPPEDLHARFSEQQASISTIVALTYVFAVDSDRGEEDSAA
jgi:hypothetical protein